MSCGGQRADRDAAHRSHVRGRHPLEREPAMFHKSLRRKSAVVSTVLLALTLAGCASSEEQIAEDMKPAVSKHDGEWTEDALRSAAGEHADQIETVTLAEDASGGVVYFRTGGHDKGDSYTKKKSKKVNGKTKTTTETKYEDDWEVECVSVTVTGKELTTESYENESSTEPVTCAPAA